MIETDDTYELHLDYKIDKSIKMQGANGVLTNTSYPESPTNSSISSCSSGSISPSSSNSQCLQLTRSKPLEERRSSNLATEATKSLTLLPQVLQSESFSVLNDIIN